MKVILSGPLGGQLDMGLQASALTAIKFFAIKTKYTPTPHQNPS